MKWLDRDLIQGPYMTLATTEREFHKAMDHCEVSKHDRPQWVSENADATVHHLTNPQGEMVEIVCIKLRPDTTGIQVAAMLVHEAVHIWQRWRESIGEDEPSREFEAYSIQTISQRLMYAYSDSLK